MRHEDLIAQLLQKYRFDRHEFDRTRENVADAMPRWVTLVLARCVNGYFLWDTWSECGGHVTRRYWRPDDPNVDVDMGIRREGSARVLWTCQVRPLDAINMTYELKTWYPRGGEAGYRAMHVGGECLCHSIASLKPQPQGTRYYLHNTRPGSPERNLVTLRPQP